MIRYMKKSNFNFADKKAKLEAIKELLKTVTVLKKSMVDLDNFLIENHQIVLFMQKFFFNNDIPAFVDKRMNRDESKAGRTLIKRVKKLNTDDVKWQDRRL